MVAYLFWWFPFISILIDLKREMWYSLIVNIWYTRVLFVERTTAVSNASPLAGFLTEEGVQLLVSGLQSLEGALSALQQPLPEKLGELQQALFLQRQVLATSPDAPLTTNQAALIIGCSPRRVRQLGRQKRIKLVRQGGRGRGRSNLYDAASVYAYRDRDQGGVEGA